MTDARKIFDDDLYSFEESLESLIEERKVDSTALISPLANFAWFHVWAKAPDKVSTEKINEVIKNIESQLKELKGSLPNGLQERCDKLLKELENLKKSDNKPDTENKVTKS